MGTSQRPFPSFGSCDLHHVRNMVPAAIFCQCFQPAIRSVLVFVQTSISKLPMQQPTVIKIISRRMICTSSLDGSCDIAPTDKEFLKHTAKRPPPKKNYLLFV